MKRGGDMGLDCAVTIPLICIYGAMLACIAFAPQHGQVAVPIYIVVANIVTFLIYYKDPTMGMGPWHASEAAFYVFLGTGGSPGYFFARCFCGHRAGEKLSEFVTAAFLMSMSSIALFAGVIIIVAVLHITHDKNAALIAMGVYFVLINMASTVIVCLDAFRQREGDMPLFAILNFIAVGGLIGGPIGICLMGVRRYREKRELTFFSIFWSVCFIVWVVLGFYGLSLYKHDSGSSMDISATSTAFPPVIPSTAITIGTTNQSTPAVSVTTRNVTNVTSPTIPTKIPSTKSTTTTTTVTSPTIPTKIPSTKSTTTTTTVTTTLMNAFTTTLNAPTTTLNASTPALATIPTTMKPSTATPTTTTTTPTNTTAPTNTTTTPTNTTATT